MKTSIQIMIDAGTPPSAPLHKTREERIEAIRKKIEYASDCIEYDHCKPQAIAFLQNLYHDLSIHKHMRNDTQMLLEKCYQLIRDYGTLPIGPNDKEDK